MDAFATWLRTGAQEHAAQMMGSEQHHLVVSWSPDSTVPGTFKPDVLVFSADGYIDHEVITRTAHQHLSLAAQMPVFFGTFHAFVRALHDTTGFPEASVEYAFQFSHTSEGIDVYASYVPLSIKLPIARHTITDGRDFCTLLERARDGINSLGIP